MGGFKFNPRRYASLNHNGLLFLLYEDFTMRCLCIIMEQPQSILSCINNTMWICGKRPLRPGLSGKRMGRACGRFQVQLHQAEVVNDMLSFYLSKIWFRTIAVCIYLHIRSPPIHISYKLQQKFSCFVFTFWKVCRYLSKTFSIKCQHFNAGH